MPVHPEIKKILDIIPKYDPNHKIIVEEHRIQMNQPALPVEQRAQVHAVEDRVVSLPDVDLTIRIYTPHEADEYRVLMYYHGGCFFSGNLESHDDVARSLCAETGHKVIAIDYRLAPEFPYPTPLNDCYNVTKWVTENKDALQWDGKNLAISGDSSGGNFVAAITLMARERKEFSITKQILLYPSLDLDFTQFRYPSLTENGTGYFVESASLLEMNSFYLKGGVDTNDPLVSPVRAESLKDLPNALVITAEFDPFRDEGELYADKLKQDGVQVVVKRYEGVTHGFLGKWTHLPEYAGVYQYIGDFLNDK